MVSSPDHVVLALVIMHPFGASAYPDCESNSYIDILSLK